jgi:hypothetical protein
MRQIACGLLVAGLIATTATAQAQELGSASFLTQARVVAATLATSSTTARVQAPAAAPKKVTVVTGADMPLMTGYVFRGIVQEFDPGFTFQPYVDVGVAASDTVTVNFGTWNSFHSGSNSEDPYDSSFYESDLYASATFLVGKWKPGVLYTLYTSPSGGYDSVGDDGSIGVSELAFSASYDDSGSSVPMSPKVVLAFELTDTQADFGDNKGVYLELGVRPTFKSSADSIVTFAVPVKFGFSLNDYYESVDPNTGDLKDNGFGYFQFGANVSVPISAIKAGAWEVHSGFDFYVLPDRRKVQQDGDDEPTGFKPVFNIVFSATY